MERNDVKVWTRLKGTTVYRSGSRGNEPLTPMSAQEAIEYLVSSDDALLGAAMSDCPSGVCDILPTGDESNDAAEVSLETSKFVMTSKDLVWLKRLITLNGFSKCPRKKFCAIIIDDDNQIVSLGYNGNLRGQCGDLCGGDSCLRDTLKIPSGQETDIGCVHAEENAILNCARQGVSCKGTTLYVNGEPCKKCAARIVQAGIHTVVYREGNYSSEGIEVLNTHGVNAVAIK